MIDYKKTIIAAYFSLICSLNCWAEAPVVDDSDNFVMNNGQQASRSVVHPKYDEPEIERVEYDKPHRDSIQMDEMPNDETAPLAKDDERSESHENMSSNAKLIDKVLNLQHDIQELRGQLEVQAHDLKLLQQQQVAFYKDLDARLGNPSLNALPTKSAAKVLPGPQTPTASAKTKAAPAVKVTKTEPAIIPVSRMNPADEQISYLAAYELVKNKQNDEAIKAMHTFIQKYPQGGYTSNAEYWLGELYMTKNNYPNAIEHFEVVLEKFPTSSKAAASMLKLGYAYAATGNRPAAKRRLEQVVKTYPKSSTAQLATLKLESINAL